LGHTYLISLQRHSTTLPASKHDTRDTLKVCCPASGSWVSCSRKYCFADIKFHSPVDPMLWTLSVFHFQYMLLRAEIDNVRINDLPNTAVIIVPHSRESARCHIRCSYILNVLWPVRTNGGGLNMYSKPPIYTRPAVVHPRTVQCHWQGRNE